MSMTFHKLYNVIFFLYVDDRCFVCHKDINKIENQLNEDFCNICDWFVDNRLSIRFGEDKTKTILNLKRKYKKSSNKICRYTN